MKQAAATTNDVFIVHGRDLPAAQSLRSFLRGQGIKARLFEEVSSKQRGARVVAEVVRAAIGRAAAVVVFLTPDERAALYDSKQGRFVQGEARWQARPNVIFEAGWAFGIKPGATLFVSLGATSFFSDIAGHVVIRLDTSSGLRQLLSQLRDLVRHDLRDSPGEDRDVFLNWDGERPDFHDELDELTLTLSNKDIEYTRKGKRSSVPLMTVLREAVRSGPEWSWSRRSPRELISAIKKRRGHVVADEAFWWFVTFGVFRFSTIDYWGNVWTDSVDNAHFAPRGLAFITWLQRKGNGGTLARGSRIASSRVLQQRRPKREPREKRVRRAGTKSQRARGR